ncbi:MAG: cob(I)yrinic acid a,c-diamide adenosyltransferase [Gemmatimonadota bacterium]
MKIYTRKGDRGETSLLGGARVAKDHVRVDAYGTIDELNAVLGWAATAVEVDATRRRLRRIQHDLFALGSDLSAPPADEGRRRPETPDPPTWRVDEMEAWIDEADTELEPLRAFVLPGGTPGAAALHVARTVCRRAERAVVALARDDVVDEGAVRYLNRLSDLLFALARLENHRSGERDVLWRKEDGPA